MLAAEVAKAVFNTARMSRRTLIAKHAIRETIPLTSS
jgi:hypothetical protein